METNLTPTAPSAWKGKIRAEGVDLLLPSENVARVKQISPVDFLEGGMIPDPLSKIIREAISTKQGMPPSKMKKIAEDPKMLPSALLLFDRMLCHAVIEPEIQMPPACDVKTRGTGVCGEYANHEVHKGPEAHRYHEGPRDESVLYADQVDMDDKTFIFNWCLGGVTKLDKFREEHAATMESLSDSEDVAVSSK